MVKDFVERSVLCFNLIRVFPLAIGFVLTGEKEYIKKDVEKWSPECRFQGKNIFFNFFKLIANYKEFRSLYYYRLGSGSSVTWLFSKIMRLIYKPEPSLYIWANKIGAGLFIQHGLCTMISAESIGDNCWINQQVMIGWNIDKAGIPTVGNNVRICSGAKVLGKITLGDNVIVGANAVVVRNVPSNCTVVGVPAHIVKRDGKKTNERLA